MSNLHPPSSTPKKSKHPTTRKMVDEALTSLNESKGCSFKAIKKFMTSSYQVDIKKLSFYIKKYIRDSVENGKFIQITGYGANGSFRLSAAAKRNPNKFLHKKAAGGKKSKQSQKVQFKITGHRTSLTRFPIMNGRSERTPKPRYAKMGKQYSLSSESDDSPSTSIEALRRAEGRKK